MIAEKMYEKYIGSITPVEFIAPFHEEDDAISAAINSVTDDWVWNEPIPESFYSVVYGYVQDYIKSEQ